MVTCSSSVFLLGDSHAQVCFAGCFVTLFTDSIAQASSYQKTDRTIVDPIRDTGGRLLYYSGNNVEPSANLTVTDSMDLHYSHTYGNP